MNQEKWVNDAITINGKEIQVKNGTIAQADLKFWIENPRIYSISRAGGTDPSQQEIEHTLQEREHVKELVQSIKANGGLIDPLLVRDSDLIVLEGNSRLAAYRLLARNDPIRWGEVKVRLLPANLNDNLVFALLGEYHIIGRKDWAPYEQAGYLYRRVENQGVSPKTISREVGLAMRTVNNLLEVYRFMVEHGDNDADRWSYYVEYLKPKNRRARQEHPNLDSVVVSKIKTQEIRTAIEVRDKVNKIIQAGHKSIGILMSGEQTLERAYTSAIDRGVDNAWLKVFKKFRADISTQSTLFELQVMKDDQLKKCLFELNKIEQQIRSLRGKLG